jgi:hypothetical protein
MYFDFSEEQLMIRQAARDFAQTELKPGVIDRDEHQKFPAEQVKMMGELGFLGNDGIARIWRYRHGCYILRIGNGRTLKDRCFCICSGIGKQFIGMLRFGEIWQRGPKAKIFSTISQRRRNRRILFVRA